MKTTEEQSKESLNTPLPWLPYYLAMGGTMMGDNDHRYIVGTDGVLVADLYADTNLNLAIPPTHDEVEANCELICRAVNNHQSLIDMLSEVVDDWDVTGCVSERLVENCRAVLANAKVQP